MKSKSLTIEKVKRIHVEKRENPIVNRLNKTKVEKYPDLAMEKEARLKELRKKDQATQQARVSVLNYYCLLRLESTSFYFTIHLT